ncbi:MAG TPA: lysophospholipid acyltransferase family protein [Candidatus Kapabacteria bacterium]|nr:lysophospholipid acyltransferase family protein [Candidatus Kapabacteria bacterium]
MLSLFRCVGGLLGRLAFWAGIRSKVTLDNLARAFPELRSNKRRRMASNSYANLGTVFFEFLYLRFAGKDSIRNGLEITNLTDVLPVISNLRGAILLSGHLGNWEWLALGCALRIGSPLDVIIKNQRASKVEEFLVAMRTRFGNRMLDAGNVRAIFRALRSGEVLAILGDQAASAEDVRVPFFGVEVPAFEGVARLALATRAPILFLQPFARTRRGYRCRFTEVPFDDLADASAPNVRELTARHTRVLEQAIREKPELWLWQHRRWKHVTE